MGHEEHPFRAPSAPGCPKCRSHLLVEEGGVQACPKGCGDWVPLPGLEDAVPLGALLAMPAPNRWWKRSKPLACPECRRPLDLVGKDELRVDLCPAHGAWFQPGERARASTVFFTEILVAREQARVQARIHERTQELVTHLVGLDRGGAEAMAKVIARLEESLFELERIVRGKPRGR